ncbi:MAG TPA: hypothetical protein VMV54_00485 [Acidocella sp.]|nr:hypothetical protein [Acidocella sp.]
MSNETGVPPEAHPDEDLLVVAERALGIMSTLDAEYKAPVPAGRDAQVAHARELTQMSMDVQTLLRGAAKIRAQTPAGVYAKAQLVSRSRSGAPMLAKSLAADMIEMPGLRRLLWPAQVI